MFPDFRIYCNIGGEGAGLCGCNFCRLCSMWAVSCLSSQACPHGLGQNHPFSIALVGEHCWCSSPHLFLCCRICPCVSDIIMLMWWWWFCFLKLVSMLKKKYSVLERDLEATPLFSLPKIFPCKRCYRVFLDKLSHLTVCSRPLKFVGRMPFD